MVSGYHLFPVAPTTWVNAISAREVTSVNRRVDGAPAPEVSVGACGSDCPITGDCTGTCSWERSQNSPSPRLVPTPKTMSTHRPPCWKYVYWRRIALSPKKITSTWQLSVPLKLSIPVQPPAEVSGLMVYRRILHGDMPAALGVTVPETASSHTRILGRSHA